ncbi:Na+-dependent transporter [Enterovirga rhinocerotis]|uniref:BASS family bile acid:Na+ symporter n=1 Tax=Enterovirga rhinocerotis TaxID=1339210 RepID=A0A4R7BVP0_9HYPH|nr:Na+-dependent transporter [Enterovirga rhinocerotis]TDR89910.1 BASS family bile acid:Na+ symporter [Enterovirga rhinocerotis]
MIDSAQILGLTLNVSIFLVVFALGLKTQRGDAVYLYTRPSLLLRSLLAMNVVMVVVAVVINALFDLPLPVEVALIALAVSPVPPVLPAKQTKAGGSASYAISLMGIASAAAIVIAPLALILVGALFGRAAAVPGTRIAMIVLVSVILPLAAGIAVRFIAPDAARRLARPISILGTILLAIGILPVLFMATGTLWAMVGNGVLMALVAFALIGLAVGHVLGGPEPEHRAVLALATSTRHPGIAIAIASLAFPDEKAVMAVVLYHLVVGALVCVPYVRWGQGHAGARQRT